VQFSSSSKMAGGCLAPLAIGHVVTPLGHVAVPRTRLQRRCGREARMELRELPRGAVDHQAGVSRRFHLQAHFLGESSVQAIHDQPRCCSQRAGRVPVFFPHKHYFLQKYPVTPTRMTSRRAPRGCCSRTMSNSLTFLGSGSGSFIFSAPPPQRHRHTVGSGERGCGNCPGFAASFGTFARVLKASP